MTDLVTSTLDPETLGWCTRHDMPVKIFSYAELERQVNEGAMQCYVGPDEGSAHNGRWTFNDKHEGFQYLIVDVGTARLVVQSYGIVKPENATKMVTHIEKGRGHFVQIAELLWGSASFGGGKGPVKYGQ